MKNSKVKSFGVLKWFATVLPDEVLNRRRSHFSDKPMIDTAKLLCELIAIPSVNPSFVAEDYQHAGESRVADFLAALAKKNGLETEFQKALPGRSNLLARLTPTGKIKQRILLAPHLDTVPVADDAQFSPITKGGKIYGRGACDTKGSVAAMFSALCQLAQSKKRPTETEIIFAGLVDEENRQSGSQAFVASGLKADLAIVGEPTEAQIVTAHKGSLWLRLETKGKAAHGARPELGQNAVHEMAQIIDLLETKYRAQLRKRRHPLLGHATSNVGTVRGGTQPNIVPDYCDISVDRRMLPGETESSVRREIKKLLADAGKKATLKNYKTLSGLAMEADWKQPLIQQFFRTTGQTKPVGVDYFCDASILSNGGIPSVVFGPGNIAQAHTKDEWISIRSLNQATGLLSKFLSSLP